MANAAVDYPPAINPKADINMADTTTTVPAWQTPPTTGPHPQTAEIIRQIDHYFSDDNLRQDAHLLGLIKEGNGTVSLNEVMGFKRMRKYKPSKSAGNSLSSSFSFCENQVDLWSI
jgi:hypothetical protein